MQSERILSEIKTITKKYSLAVFELEKCKETVKKLETEKDDLFQKHQKCNEIISNLKTEKELVSTQLREALEKIDFLTSDNAKSNKQEEIAQDANSIVKHVNVVPAKKPVRGERIIRQLQAEKNILESRLRQAECGIKLNDDFKNNHTNLSDQDEDFEVERILDHKIQRRGKRLFLIRWKGYGEDFDTWEPQSNLNCPTILQNYIKHNKM